MADLTAQIAAGMAVLTVARTATMADTCTITRPSSIGQTPVLDADGNITPADPVTVYEGPCVLARFKSTGTRTTTPNTIDDADGVPEPRTLKVPHDADVQAGDLVVMTACPFAPELVGGEFRVLHEDPRTYATFRSFFVRGSSWQSPAG